MRNLFCFLLILTLTNYAISQQNEALNINLPIEDEYLELRFVPNKGMKFRLSSDLPFQKAGIFNKNLKPYFKQDDEALRYYRQHNFSYLGTFSSSMIYVFGLTFSFQGLTTNNQNMTRIAGGSAIIGLGGLFLFNHLNISSIYNAVDSYNRGKNLNLERGDYFEVATHPFTIWKYRTNASDKYQSDGFNGRKLASYFKDNEAAYDAYKKFNIGHILYSIGNLTVLAGTGMAISGFWTNNGNLRKNGFLTMGGSLILVFTGTNIMANNLYRAVDLINHKQSSILNSSFMPSIQPSSHSAGIGLVWNIN